MTEGDKLKLRKDGVTFVDVTDNGNWGKTGIKKHTAREWEIVAARSKIADSGSTPQTRLICRTTICYIRYSMTSQSPQ